MECSIKQCSKRVLAKGLCSMHYSRKALGKPMHAPDKRALSYDELFDTKVGKPNKRGCRNWRSGKDSDGYGLFTAKGRPTVRAHRYAYERVHGPLGGRMACHRCDNTSCVEPSHIFAGDAVLNSADMVAKGRSLRGAANNKAKLSVADVRAIRASGESKHFLASKYGVSIVTIYKVRRGETWPHIS